VRSSVSMRLMIYMVRKKLTDSAYQSYQYPFDHCSLVLLPLSFAPTFFLQPPQSRHPNHPPCLRRWVFVARSQIGLGATVGFLMAQAGAMGVNRAGISFVSVVSHCSIKYRFRLTYCSFVQLILILTITSIST
jgi:hypothetical protein